MSKPNVSEQIEALIDATSLLDVLTALELVTGEKALHIVENWQDAPLAKRWDKASRIIGKAMREIDPLDI